MASIVDVRLIDPTEAELAATLKKAHAAANRGVGARSTKLDRDADFWSRFARDCLREPAGRRRSCKAGPQTPEVIAGWWTDPANRRHFRVIGRLRSRYGRMRGEGELRDLPPWWQVYPESVLAVRRADQGEDEESYMACCRCGATGSPESLGWMGDTCGPCFDRKADGGVAAGGFGHFSGWGGWQPRVGFSADGTQLVGSNRTNKLRMVARADGAEIVGKSVSPAVAVVVGTGEGFVCASGEGSVSIWDGTESAARRVLAKPRVYGRVLLDPTGRRVVTLSHNFGFTADLADAEPAYHRVEGLRGYATLRFAADGSRLFALMPSGQLVSLDPETLAETVLRENIFEASNRYGALHDLITAPDSSAVAVVREIHYPSLDTVRIIPLHASEPMYDLPLPRWFKPRVAAFAPDSKHIAVADPQTGWVGFWKLPSVKSLGFVRAVPEDPSYRGGQLLFSPDGHSVAMMYCGSHPERGSTVVVWPWPDVTRFTI